MAFFVIGYSAFVLYGAIWNKQPIIDFANDNNKLFVGALLGALTGRAITAIGFRFNATPTSCAPGCLGRPTRSGL